MRIRSTLLMCASIISFSITGQHEQKKWYFGTFAGLDFMTSPPTVLTNGGIWTSEGCGTISDASGNLLFYTDGANVFDKTHKWMPNGFGLSGHESATQSGFVVKDPGTSNLYYIFTLDAEGGAAGLRYSIVDMSLLGGLGDVTQKNILLHTPSTEKLAATSHCNGVDVWLLSHDYGSNVFRAYLITTTGISSSVITSAVGPVVDTSKHTMGQMKFSPDGKKVGLASYDSGFELYDFNPATGQVSNYLALSSRYWYEYGCEFSPDGTKFYGSRHPPFFGLTGAHFIQWDLCAGSNTAIVASQYSITIPGTVTAAYGQGGMQLAPDGNIYIATSYEQSLSVIYNPNGAGVACNYSHLAQSIAPKHVAYTLPSMVVYHSAKPMLAPFTWTPSCQTVSFTPPPGIISPSTIPACTSVTQTPASLLWLFGDTGSSSTATSTATHPQYAYSGTGTFTATLIVNYPCNSDTLRVPVTITNSAAVVSISGKTVLCQGESTILTASGASNYNWNGTSTQNSIMVSPVVTTSYTVSGSSGSTVCPITSAVITVSVSTCTGIDRSPLPSVRLFPNPVRQTLNVNSDVEAETEIINSSGTSMLKFSLLPGETKIEAGHLPAGIYFARITSGQQMWVMKFCKQAED